MAIFRLQITPVTRSANQSAVAAAAYRAGEKIRDDRTNEVHNHSRRKDVTHSEILLPGYLSGSNMDWALNRASLWNSVEQAESRKNARVATEIQVTLPFELPAGRRIEIARAFSREIADNYKVAVDLAVHDPRPAGDPRNSRAPLLTTREVTPTGLGTKTGLNLQMNERIRLGLPDDRNSKQSASVGRRSQMMRLKAANIEARVDHRSLAEQGLIGSRDRTYLSQRSKSNAPGSIAMSRKAVRADYDARREVSVGA